MPRSIFPVGWGGAGRGGRVGGQQNMTIIYFCNKTEQKIIPSRRVTAVVACVRTQRQLAVVVARVTTQVTVAVVVAYVITQKNYCGCCMHNNTDDGCCGCCLHGNTADCCCGCCLHGDTDRHVGAISVLLLLLYTCMYCWCYICVRCLSLTSHPGDSVSYATYTSVETLTQCSQQNMHLSRNYITPYLSKHCAILWNLLL